MTGYLSKIAVRSGAIKPGGKKTDFISSALRAANDDTDIIQKEPATAIGQAFEHPEPIRGWPQGESPDALPETGNTANGFSINPAKVDGKNTHPPYLNNLANRNDVAGSFDEKNQNIKMTVADDFTIFHSDRVKQEINEPAKEKAENQSNKATKQPAEIAWKQKPDSQQHHSEVQDFFAEIKTSENLEKKTDIKRPEHIEPRLKNELSPLKISEKEPARNFNPVENHVVTQLPGRKGTGQKLIIGKITVEILPSQPAPLKIQPSVNRRGPNTANDKNSPVHKLSFGLGQL